ncbi:MULTISPECIES: peptide ABC transporter substrate-binding protein [Carnobacterium]|uniref:Oligopeptide transport system substrate-binding protein n=1 Tax=Carnobacterium alterfunditum TaxID=28230 RepID=A0A1N6GDB3_9LACT|nr:MULTISPECIES: peptide ABC transporter substrate-binding protein [Carnobacterium]MBT2731194.1 peptide ABC transporter substrate-binding protein [Carnobacterium sp. ISL-102]SIO05520.1 oligopeptide transport system substrate-binding protein [Carnobacterium alterfunditum]
MEKKKYLQLMGLSLASVSLLAACGGDSEESTTDKDGNDKQVLNLVESAELPTMDSVLATDSVSFNVMNNVNEGLLRQGPDGELELGMAEEEPVVSEDGLTYTFKIREDAVWSNGDPVTANDFVFSWTSLATPETAAEYSYMIDGVVANATAILQGEMEPSELGVTAVDDKTLEIQLEKAVPYFESLTTLSMFFPQNEAYVTEKGEAYASNSDNILYNGPFVLDEWDGTGLSWVMNKNEDYWDADAVELDTINIDVIKETSTALNLYDTGSIDRMVLSGDYVQTQQGNSDLKTQPTSTVAYLKFNQERNGEETALANENIRKAIAMAFDKQAYVDTVLQNGSIPADGLVPEALAVDPATGEDYREQNGDLLSFDNEKAQEYFDKGLDELGVDSLSLEILSDDTENAKKSIEFLQGQLTQNLQGLEISLRNVPFKVRLDADSNQDYDIQLALWGADYADPINFLELFHAENGNNNSGYDSAEYNSLVESAQTNVTDLESRWQDMLDAEKVLMEEAGIAPIYQRAYAILEKDYVKDFTTHLVGAEWSFKWTSVTN